MKIDLTKDQYRDLIVMSGISNFVLGILGESLPDTGYKKRSDAMEKLEEYLLEHAKDFDSMDLVQNVDGQNVLSESAYETDIVAVMDDYDENEFFEELASRLAKRDFRDDHTVEEIQKMAKKNDGYFGVELEEYEERYYEEFEEHGVDRLKVDGGQGG